MSYFHRASRKYVALLKMGHWFGYRPGYEDLFKLWMGEQTKEWFEFIHKACDELRSEIAYMNKSEKTPKEFGLKVLNSPDTLMITASNKMRTAQNFEQLVSLSGKLVESSSLSKKSNHLNMTMTEHFLRGIHGFKVLETDKKSECYERVDHDRVAEFLHDFISHPSNLVFDGIQISTYILNNKKNLRPWTVCIASGSVVEQTVAGEQVKINQRTMLLTGDSVRVGRSRIGSVGATKRLLTDEQIEKAKIDYLLEPKKGKGSKSGKITVPDRIYLRYAPNPILFIL